MNQGATGSPGQRPGHRVTWNSGGKALASLRRSRLFRIPGDTGRTTHSDARAGGKAGGERNKALLTPAPMWVSICTGFTTLSVYTLSPVRGSHYFSSASPHFLHFPRPARERDPQRCRGSLPPTPILLGLCS